MKILVLDNYDSFTYNLVQLLRELGHGAATTVIRNDKLTLEAVAAMTGLRFACVARVTGDSWTTCAVLDRLEFGLKIGDGLDVSTTLCEEVRDTGKAPRLIRTVRGSGYLLAANVLPQAGNGY